MSQPEEVREVVERLTEWAGGLREEAEESFTAEDRKEPLADAATLNRAASLLQAQGGSGPCSTCNGDGAFYEGRHGSVIPCPDCHVGKFLRGREEAREAEDRYHGALRAIRGPEDQGPWIEVYQKAGGGYAGLQAIAEEALK